MTSATPPTAPADVKARALANLRAETIEALRQLADARTKLADADAEIETQERALYESAPYREAAARVNEWKAVVALAETTVKTLGLDAYRANPENKKPAPGVGIRVKMGVEYEDAAALPWCKAKGLFLIPEAIDRTSLEKFLLTNTSPLDLPHRITETPTVTIAKDVADALAKETA